MKCKACKLYEVDSRDGDGSLCTNCAGLEWMTAMEKAQTVFRAHVQGVEYSLESLLGEGDKTLAQHIDELLETHTADEVLELVNGSHWWVGSRCNPPQEITLERE